MKKETRYLLITSCIDLIIALLLYRAIYGAGFMDKISPLAPYIVIAVMAVLFSAYFIGQNLFKTKKLHSYRYYHGVLSIALVLSIGILMGTLAAFIFEGFPNYFQNNQSLLRLGFNYIGKPFIQIIIWGAIPTIISGLTLGVYLRKIR